MHNGYYAGISRVAFLTKEKNAVLLAVGLAVKVERLWSEAYRECIATATEKALYYMYY